MYCLALSLDSSSNKNLFQIGSYICNYQKTSLLIEKFHLTLICLEKNEECDSFISDIKEDSFALKKIIPMRWEVLEGKMTDFDYLVLEVFLPKQILSNLNDVRKKYIHNKYFDLKPHISVVKGPKGSFSKELVQHLNEKYAMIPTCCAKELLHFENFIVVKKTDLDTLTEPNPK